MANENKASKDPLTFSVQASVARPADTNAYTANDAVANATSSPSRLTFSGIAARETEGGTILSVVVTSSVVAVTDVDITILLFDEAITALEDNAAVDVSDSEIQTLVGSVSITEEDWIVLANNKYVVKAVSLPFVCGSSNILDAAIRVDTAHTPASAEVYTITLGGVRD